MLVKTGRITNVSENPHISSSLWRTESTKELSMLQ